MSVYNEVLIKELYEDKKYESLTHYELLRSVVEDGGIETAYFLLEEIERELSEAESIDELAVPDDAFDLDAFEDVLVGEDLGDVDMSTYNQADNKNSECEGGGCTI